MQFTHYICGHISNNHAGSSPETLQVFSIKLTEIAAGLAWPLAVYGVIAVRDIADHNRNLLFCCDRSQAQELNQDVRTFLIFSSFYFKDLGCMHPLLLVNGVIDDVCRIC